MPDSVPRPQVELVCRGHENVSATHRGTLELTRDPDLTPRGTCIVGVAGAWDARALARLRGRIRVRLRAGSHEDTLEAEVSRSPSSLASLVFRKGPDLADRTFAFHTTAGATDLSRGLVEALASPDAVLSVGIEQVALSAGGPGTLYVVGLPGEDDVVGLLPRARRALERADVVLAEDPRRFRRLARQAGVTYETVIALLRPDEGGAGAGETVEQAVTLLHRGTWVALVSDAAVPVLGTAASEVVRRAAGEGVPIVAVPSPSAPVAAVMAAGFPTDGFLFVGRLPRRKDQRRAGLARLAGEPMAVVLVEEPPRLRPLLADLAEVVPGRALFVGRELTKLHEQHVHTTTTEAVHLLAGTEPRGEHTLVIAPAKGLADTATALDPATARLVELLRRHVPTKTLASALSTAAGLPRRTAYDLARADSDTDE